MAKVKLKSGKSADVGATFTKGKYTYTVQSDGSVKRADGKTTAGATNQSAPSSSSNSSNTPAPKPATRSPKKPATKAPVPATRKPRTNPRDRVDTGQVKSPKRGPAKRNGKRKPKPSTSNNSGGGGW
jgi:hypothetical protein